MNFFKKLIKKNVDNTFSDQLTERVIALQHKLANYLNQKTHSLNGKTLLFALIFFCLLFGTYFLWLITAAFN